MALGRQPPALDRVGEHDARAGRGPRRPGGSRRAARRGRGRRGRGTWPAARRPRGRRRPPRAAAAARPRRRAAAAGTPRWASRRSAPRSASWRGELRPVLDHHAVPAGGLEHRREPARRDVRHDAVERLAVEVDDPHHLAEPRHHRVGDRLPARALVELGVADQRDLAAADRHVEVPGDVAVRERAPDRRGRADADRAGRVVDRVGVLGARRVGLQPAELAQRRQVARLEPAEQVVDRVQHRRRVRLDRHAVGRLEEREPQRGHQRHHRGARGLVAADLHARAVRAARGWRGGRSPPPATARASARRRARRARPRSAARSRGSRHHPRVRAQRRLAAEVRVQHVRVRARSRPARRGRSSPPSTSPRRPGR